MYTALNEIVSSCHIETFCKKVQSKFFFVCCFCCFFFLKNHINHFKNILPSILRLLHKQYVSNRLPQCMLMMVFYVLYGFWRKYMYMYNTKSSAGEMFLFTRVNCLFSPPRLQITFIHCAMKVFVVPAPTFTLTRKFDFQPAIPKFHPSPAIYWRSDSSCISFSHYIVFDVLTMTILSDSVKIQIV